ncbi:MAG: RNA pseudouridine synthase, partial [Clostridiales bacterium]|nr:RNA pseudouridine synthase [Clostridiales bacterium]
MIIKKEDIQIMYEDNHVLVVVKPQGVPSQEDESKDPDMVNLLKEYLVEKYEKPGGAYLGLVHRLDRPTGGVMVFAKTSKAAARLQESMKEGEFEKTYFAVTEGVPREKSDRLVHYLLKNEEQNLIRVVPLTTTGAKKAELTYKTLATTGDKTLALLSINLHTGRGH